MGWNGYPSSSKGKLDVSGCPNCPQAPAPHVNNYPSSETATVWAFPQAMCFIITP